MDEDERGTWLLARVLALFDPQPGDDGLPYAILLWRLQALNTQPVYPQEMARKGKPLPEGDPGVEEDAMREALAYFAPRLDDGALGRSAVALRLLEVVDRELIKWASAPTQDRSPTGVAVLPGTPLIVEP